MATVTRVPLVSTTSSGLAHCNKSNWVEASLSLRRQRGSFRFHHKSLSSPFFASSSFLAATNNRRGFTRLGVVVSAAMAALPTVLVTGAGGRTGTPVYILFSCMYADEYHVFRRGFGDFHSVCSERGSGRMVWWEFGETMFESFSHKGFIYRKSFVL